jgi:hypothetical protein
MISSIHTVSSPACTASTEGTERRRRGGDFVTGYCGLSPPTLFERIGIMAAESSRLTAGVLGYARMRSSAGEAFSDLIATGPAHGVSSRIRMRHAKGVTGPAGPGKDVTVCHRSGQQLRSRGMHARAGPVARSGQQHWMTAT